MRRLLMCAALAAVAAAPGRGAAQEDGAAARPGGKTLSEIRLGVLAHDRGPFSRHEEDGVDGNVELLFDPWEFLDFAASPRPQLGMTVNSAGRTNAFYMGLSWRFDVAGGVFAGFSAAAAIHDGRRKSVRADRKELGCRILFRGSLEAGVRLDEHQSVSVMFDRLSNLSTCDPDEGLPAVGLRYGYSF